MGNWWGSGWRESCGGGEGARPTHAPCFAPCMEALYDNASLCQDDAEALAASIDVGGTVSVYDNHGACE